jgi:hypothetical protein
MRGSTASTIDPADLRPYFGGASNFNAARTVFLEGTLTEGEMTITLTGTAVVVQWGAPQ